MSGFEHSADHAVSFNAVTYHCAQAMQDTTRTREWGWAGRTGLKKSQGCVSYTRWGQAGREWLENRRAGAPATAWGLVPSCPPPPGVHQYRQTVSVFSQQLEGMCEGLGPGPGARVGRQGESLGLPHPPEPWHKEELAEVER